MQSKTVVFGAVLRLRASVLAFLLCLIHCGAVKAQADVLIEASKDGDLQRVKAVLAAGTDVNSRDDYGTTALMVAVEKYHMDVVKALIDAKADVNVKTTMGGMFRPSKGSTALMMAAQEGQSEAAGVLLSSGCDVNATDDAGFTALILAAWQGNVTVYTNVSGSSSKGLAGTEVKSPQEGFRRVTELLLGKGAQVNAKTREGATALTWASEKGHLEVAQELLANRADPNVRMNDGATPLMHAAHNGYDELVHLLLAKGADVSAQDATGNSALILAAIKGNTKIVKELITRGADINAKTTDGHTALEAAAMSGNPETKALLVQAGAK